MNRRLFVDIDAEGVVKDLESEPYTKSFYKNPDYFDSIKNNLRLSGKRYSIRQKGSVTNIYTNHRLITFKPEPEDYVSNKEKSILLRAIKEVNHDVLTFKKRKGKQKSNGLPPFRSFDYSVFRHYFVEKKIKTFYLFDVTSAYWNTAYQLGYISKNTFLKYEDNKLVRLIALGYLGMSEVWSHYEGGKLISTEKTESELSWAWINTTYESFKKMGELAKILKYDFLAIQTDGIYIDPTKYEIVKRHFEDNDIKYNLEHLEVLGRSEHYLVVKNLLNGEVRRTALFVKKEDYGYFEEIKI